MAKSPSFLFIAFFVFVAECDASSLRIGVFNVDATPAIGTPVAYVPTTKILDPLSARGIVILSEQKPIVLCAVDWIGIGNSGYATWRAKLASAAGTDVSRVAVHTLHQHDGPRCDFSIEALLARHGLQGIRFDNAFSKQVIERVMKGIKTAIANAKPVTHFGIGQAQVEKVASNRRLLGEDGKVKIVRYSKSTDPAAIAAPEGVIDPYLKMVTFWNKNEPVVALTYYATHPQSYYGQGEVTSEFVGIARSIRERETKIPHIHFNGAGGNIAAGKYNDGSEQMRPILARRMADGMKLAWEATQRIALTPAKLRWQVEHVHLPPSPHLNKEELFAKLRKASSTARDKMAAAADLAWLTRTEHDDPIEISCLQLGDLYLLHMPGELFVEYQLAAQEQRPNSFVCLAAYGDYGPGYIGTKIAYSQGGYEVRPSVSRVSAEVEEVLTNAVHQLLAGSDAKGEHHGHQHSVSTIAAKSQYRPTPVPDRIILSWASNPSTTQAVTWRTDISVSHPKAQIVVAKDGPDLEKNAITAMAKTEPLESDIELAHYHSVEFTNLIPDTKYAYRVGGGNVWSEWIHFQTASVSAKPFTFVYFGDAQNDLKSRWSRVVREAFSDAPQASFMLHAGDLVNQANRDAEWGEWFYAGSFIHRMIPCIATPGNHEYFKVKDDAGETVERKLSRNWKPTFTFPQNGPDGLKESAYWLDYQGVRVVSLNSNEQLEKQSDWLDRVLRDNPNKWTILTFHHPVYSSKAGRDNPELRDLWQPVFDKHRVDLVLQGHDHTYARTQKMAFQKNLSTGVTFRSEDAGTVYVVSVSGPKMYELGKRPFMRRTAENTQLYQIIRIDRNALHYEARTATGRLYDAFTLKKTPGKVNELIDRITDEVDRDQKSHN